MQQMKTTKMLLKQTNCLCMFLFQIALDLKKKQNVFSLTSQDQSVKKD